MPNMTIAEVEVLTDSNRWQHMLALGKRASTNAAERAIVTGLLANTNFYHRRLAMMAVCASADKDTIATTLQGSSTALAALACRLAALHLDDDMIVQLVPNLVRPRRRLLVQACAAVGRTAPLNRLFERLSQNDRCEFIAYAGPPFASSKLAQAEFAELLSPLDWTRIARRQPDIVLPLLAERLESDVLPQGFLLPAIQVALNRAAMTSPGAGLEFLRRVARVMPMHQLFLGPIASRYPAETAAVVLADLGERVPQFRPSVLRRVDAVTCRALVEHGAVALSARAFRRLSPAIRHSLYAQGLLEPLRDKAGTIETAYVGLLPRAERLVEATRAWSAPQYQAIPGRRIPYLAFFPFDQALQLAATFISQPDAELRGMAGAAVIGAARYEPQRLSEALAFVRHRTNEQDPVRQALIDALARLPGARWTDAHLPEISGIIAEALASRDCSAQTIVTASRWLVAMSPDRIEFSARELGKLAERLGQIPRVDLEGRFTNAQMAALTSHFLPLLELWRVRDYNTPIIGLLRNFGRRLLAAPKLLDFVERMSADRRRGIADGALEILSGIGAKDRLRKLVPRLLNADPSWVLSRTVAGHLDRYRQDLLGEYLRPRVYDGLFSTNKAAVLPNFTGHFARWTLKQQQLYAQSLLSIANSSQRSAWELRRCLDVLARMPAIDPTPIEQLASLETKDVALRDMAVVLLGRLDDARGLPTLAAALDDDRGRVAIYAVRRIVLAQPPDRAINFLSKAPMKKVTVAKEVVRLAGEIEGDAARSFLAEIADRPDLHKDVRIAVMRALWSQLESPETWQIFSAAARGDAPAAIATVRIPQDRLSNSTKVRLSHHLAFLLAHADPRVRRETLQRLVTNPVTVGEPMLANRLRLMLATLDDQEARLVAAALVLNSSTQDIGELAELFAAIDEPRALQEVIEALIERVPYQGRRVQPIAEQLVVRLISRRKQIGLAMRLAVRTLPALMLRTAVHQASLGGALHAGAMMEALVAIPHAVGNRRGAEIGGLEVTFAAADDAMVRRIGLAALAGRAAVAGWSDQARARLAVYRRDPDALVHEAASLTFPPDPPATVQAVPAI